MAIKEFKTTGDEAWDTGIYGNSDKNFRVLKYTGSLGGGTISVHSTSPDVSGSGVIETPVSDAKLTAAKVDDNNDPIKQFTFQTSGKIVVKLTGATNPNCKIIVE